MKGRQQRIKCNAHVWLYNTLVSLPEVELSDMRSEFDIADEASFDAVIAQLMAMVREVSTCSNLNVPVEVWIDSEGWYTVRVY